MKIETINTIDTVFLDSGYGCGNRYYYGNYRGTGYGNGYGVYGIDCGIRLMKNISNNGCGISVDYKKEIKI